MLFSSTSALPTSPTIAVLAEHEDHVLHQWQAEARLHNDVPILLHAWKYDPVRRDISILQACNLGMYNHVARNWSHIPFNFLGDMYPVLRLIC